MVQEESFWDYWKETKIGALRQLSRKEVQHYYDYFSGKHYSLNPDSERIMCVAASDRMLAIQSELQHRRIRNLQISIAILAAFAALLTATLAHFESKQPATPDSASASTGLPTSQTASPEPLSTSPSNPSSKSSLAQPTQPTASPTPLP